MNPKDNLHQIAITLVEELRGVRQAITKHGIVVANGAKPILSDKEAAHRLGFKRQRGAEKSYPNRFMDRAAESLGLGKPIYIERRRFWLAKTIDEAVARLAAGAVKKRRKRATSK